MSICFCETVEIFVLFHRISKYLFYVNAGTKIIVEITLITSQFIWADSKFN